MADYTTTAKITQRLGPHYNSTTKLTAAHIGAFITQVSGEIDTALSRLYTTPFNAIDADPATPDLVVMACEARVLYLCLDQLGTKGNSNDLSEAMDRNMARFSEHIAMLRSDDFQMLPEHVSGETVTFAGSTRKAWDVGEWQAILANGALNPMAEHQTNYLPPNILEEGLQISSSSTPESGSGLTGSQLATFPRGSAFDVEFDSARHRWVLTVNAPELRNAATLKVDYPWDYRRKAAMSRRTSPRLALG